MSSELGREEGGRGDEGIDAGGTDGDDRRVEEGRRFVDAAGNDVDALVERFMKAALPVPEASCSFA